MSTKPAVIGRWSRQLGALVGRIVDGAGSAGADGGAPPRLEALEDRRMLSGVTLIAHGFGADAGAGSWVAAMADAIAAEPGVNGVEYRVTVTDGGTAGSPIVVGTPQYISGLHPEDAASKNPEIILLLDWSALAGTLPLGGYTRSTVDVGAAVTAKLTDPAFLADIGAPLAGLPIHMIGADRGGALVSEIAKDLGTEGIWVDQVTTLDPHPVDGTHAIDPANLGDAAPQFTDNVTFFDNYYRSDAGEPSSPDGQAVPGALNDPNTGGSSSVFETNLESAAAYPDDDANVHLWYDGTIDTSASAGDGTENVPTTGTWYGSGNTLRTTTGFYYSMIDRGARPSAGISGAFGGSSGSVPVTLDTTAGVQWPDIGSTSGYLKFAGGATLFDPDTPIPVNFLFQDYDQQATVTLYLDPDQNPFDSNQIFGNQVSVPSTGDLVYQTNPAVNVATAAAHSGTYYVGAVISDGTHLRYAYMDTPVRFTGPTVTNIAPAEGTTLAPPAVNIDVTFSEPITVGDMSPSDLILQGAARTGSTAVGTPINLGNNIWRFPVTGLGPGELDLTLQGISSPGHATIQPTSWTYNIVLPPVSIALLDGQAAESGTSGGPASDTAAIRISRGGPTNGAMVVNFTRGGTATLGAAGDYTLTANGVNLTGGTVTIPAGQDHVDITLTPVDDALAEGTETASLTLGSSGVYSLDPVAANRTVTVNILDNEPVLTVVKAADASETDPTGAGEGAFTITRDQTAGALTVNFTLTGTAGRTTDYAVMYNGAALTANAITLSDGQGTATLNVVPVDDTIAEPAETVILTLVATTSYSVNPGATAATVTIADNEPALMVVKTADASETDPAGAGQGTFTITRDQTAGALTVNFSLAGTAARTTDYAVMYNGAALTANAITLADGQGTATLNVVPVDDTIAEVAETVILTLVATTNYSVNPGATAATVTIADNEPAVTITKGSDASETDPAGAGMGWFTINREHTDRAITLNFSVSGTAGRGADYVLRQQGAATNLTANSLTLAAGTGSVIIEVIPKDDIAVEATETVNLTLKANRAYSLDPVVANRSAVANIADNEPTLTLVHGSDASETDPAGAGMGSFTLTRDQASNPVTVAFKLGGTARRTTDYILRYNGATMTGSTITLAAGQTAATLEIMPVDDHVTEATESVLLTLGPTTRYRLGTVNKSATVLISDNEPMISIGSVDGQATESGTPPADPGLIRITRSGNTADALRVYFTRGGAAGFGTTKDYTLAVDGTALTTAYVDFAPGQAFVDIAVLPVDNLTHELTKALTLTLKANAAYWLDPLLANRMATVSILDND